MVSLAISPKGNIGVAVAAYSSRRSRMWSWNTETLEILGFQDVKARVHLLDISQDGRYVGYFAEAQHRFSSYIGVSRPPYFRALFLKVGHAMLHYDLNFGKDGTIYWMAHGENPRFRLRHPLPMCPFRAIQMDSGFVTNLRFDAARGSRCSYCRFEELRDATNPVWTTKDVQGRTVRLWSNGVTVQAKKGPEIQLIDFTRTPFTEVPTPDWACEW